ncbi:MAG: TDP-N-acetylfucosamine:lipid II N-acetylfucosaminyltransferase [Clostridium sp.]|uniref:TDP-N-acetylfucosamine:lipid II N-acetylfucosaminyltransferase n=1 Tax=Clostridium sp. TaxID=1506 RepID=UPI00290D6E00|nr:TDP-N-acetylfucosamine:lipid II N-acetylfucosaminyltransferase [Clostridium sp.]MDU7253018.1 TDP-N-acetylfucosamine:lipid II N-acetylfucosaminyltransferase [Clostridium sp.]
MEELEQYEKKVKKNIEKLINSNELEEAEKVILEYEEIIKNDVDIISMKAIILIMKSELYEAEKLLIKSLNKYEETFDLLFNLAYLYEMKNNYQKAYYYYVKADKKCNNNEIGKNIQNTLSDLKYNYNADVYMEKKQVLVVAQIFPPMGGSGVQRTLKFVKYLRKFNWEPVVVTVGDTAFNYLKDSTLEDEIPNNLKIIKFDEKLNFNGNEVINLIENYTKLIQNEDIILQYKSIINKLSQENNYEEILKTLLIPDYSSFWAMDVINKIDEFVDFNSIDIIYSTSGPYSDHIIAYFLKEKYNKPWVCDFRDEWTNNPYANFHKNDLGYKMIEQMEKNILEKSNKIITTTPLARKNYIDILNVPKEKIITITNGYDEEDFQNIELSKEKNNKFTIIHNGMLYMIRTPETFLMAIKKLIDESKINKNKIEIIFSYTENKDKWINYLKENNMDSIVTFKDYMTHEDSVNLSINSNMLLLIVGPGEKNKGVYTGKIFEYLRMGKPILSLSPKDGVVDKLLNETRCGENFEFEDIGGMSVYIYKRYKEWEDNAGNKNNDSKLIRKYERKHLTHKLSNVFNQLLNEQANIKIFEENKVKVKLNAEKLINQSNFEEADKIIDEYIKTVKKDVEIYSIKAVSLIMQNRLNEAKETIKKGLLIDKNNFDLNYNLGTVYEKENKYLNAIEVYENMAFNMDDSQIRKNLIRHINGLEDRYIDKILQQLKQKDSEQESIGINYKKNNLHFMYDSEYCDKFIHFINENLPINEHKFIVIHNRDVELKRINIMSNVEILDLRYDLNRLLDYITDSSRIFIHYLSDFFCELICKLDIKKSIYWILWGGDLYNYIDFKLYDDYTKQVLIDLGYTVNEKIDKNNIYYIMRKAAIRKIKYVLTKDKWEVKLLKENFITNVKQIDFVYSNPVEYKVVNNEACQQNDIKKILIGNSRDMSNNHIDAFIKVKEALKDYDNYEVYVPLNYGGNNAYVNKVIEYGYEYFGCKFKPIFEYIEYNEYIKFLNTIDVAVFYHNRQQAVGNIRLLSSLCKKVYVKKQTETYKYLNDIGIKLYDANYIDKSIFDCNYKLLKDNSIKIVKNFGDEECLTNLKQLL